jgi:hypothetical protein
MIVAVGMATIMIMEMTQGAVETTAAPAAVAAMVGVETKEKIDRKHD